MKKPNPERPNFPGKNPTKKIYDERGVSPVIAVILMVAITVVLAAVLYVMVTGIFVDPEPPINGALDFTETDPQTGGYIGGLIYISKAVPFEDVSVTITDISSVSSASMSPLVDEGTVSCGADQLSLTYKDVNANQKLDAADMFTLQNGEKGDIIVLTHSGGNDNQICKFTLT